MEKLLYCETCGQILYKEPSLYFPSKINILCYQCDTFDTQKTESKEQTLELCAQYYNLMFTEPAKGSWDIRTNRRERTKKT